MSDLNVLVVGASIAGPMAAYWFAKAGASVTVIERFPELRPGGQNIDIRSVGVTVMRKVAGMEDAVKAKLAPLDGLSMVRDDGSPIAVMKSTGDAEQQSLLSEFEIFRGDLSQILFDLTKDHPRVRYIFDEQVASIAQTDAKAHVTFANGTPAATFDLVVAADGATSRTRAMGLNCGVREYIEPVGAWASYFTIPHKLTQDKIGLGMSAPGGRFLAVGPDRTGLTKVVAISAYSNKTDPELDRFRRAQKQGTEELKKLVARRYEGAGWKSSEIFASMMESDDFYAAEICQVKVPSLYNGNFVLIGDAGHATGPTGTGTSLAMASAYILAGEISSCNGDLKAGLEAYDQRMQPIIKDMQNIPPGVFAFMAPQTAVGVWIRNLVFRFVCFIMGFSGLFSWFGSIWSPSFGKDKYSIPDYDWER